MDQRALTNIQEELATKPVHTTVFLEGPAGTGKTTAAVARLLRLLRDGVPADSILVLLPQRTLATPYTEALRRPTVPAGGEVTVVTFGGLAQRMVELFWPRVAASAGFAAPDRPPVFLTLETAQYYVARIVRPLLDSGYFDSIKIERNRLYSQILDNLNKAAVVGFPHTEIAGRLKAAWIGEPAQARVYDEAQECAERFRAYCLANNLLDFSLQYEVFVNHLWPLPACRAYLTGRYTHLIADNIEEDTPVAHDVLAEWLPGCRSALLIYDRGAGNRRFLGADPESAYRLRSLCGEHVTFTESFVASPDMDAFAAHLARALGRAHESDTRSNVRTFERSNVDVARPIFSSCRAGLLGASLSSGDAGVGGRRDRRARAWRGRPAGRDRRAGAVPHGCAALLADPGAAGPRCSRPLAPTLAHPARGAGDAVLADDRGVVPSGLGHCARQI